MTHTARGGRCRLIGLAALALAAALIAPMAAPSAEPTVRSTGSGATLRLAQATTPGATASEAFSAEQRKAIEGIISERDIVRAASQSGPGALDGSVGSVMSTDVVTCSAGDGVDRLMALMTERRIRHLPVVDERGQLTGIVSIGDVVKARLSELEQENHALAEYITGR